MREHFSEKYEQVKADYREKIQEYEYEHDIMVQTMPKPKNNKKINNEYERAKEKYGLLREKKEERGDEMEPSNITYPADTDGVTIDTSVPYIIETDEFETEFKNHDKVTLYYYEPDDTLTGEDEVIMDDIDRTVGYDNLDDFTNWGVNTIYVRNERLGIDYEIIHMNTSYQEAVMGINNPVEVKPRKKGGRFVEEQ